LAFDGDGSDGVLEESFRRVLFACGFDDLNHLRRGPSEEIGHGDIQVGIGDLSDFVILILRDADLRWVSASDRRA